MTLEKILETLLDAIDCCPCELNIPCPFFEPDNEDAYCTSGNCVKGLTKLVNNITATNKKEN